MAERIRMSVFAVAISPSCWTRSIVPTGKNGMMTSSFSLKYRGRDWMTAIFGKRSLEFAMFAR